MNIVRTSLIAIAIVTVASLGAAESEGGRLLRRAFEASEQASFAAETVILSKDYRGESHDEAVPMKCRFFRSYTPEDGLRLRLEILGGRLAEEIYIKNTKGQFGVAEGVAAEIREIPVLWSPELTHYAIPESELEKSAYTIGNADYRGRACYLLSMQSPNRESELEESDFPSPDIFKEFKKAEAGKRVTRRVFLIDRENLVIYARKHYNRNGKVIFSIELGDVDFHADQKPSLYQPGWWIGAKVSTPEAFFQKAFQTAEKNRRPAFSQRMGVWWADLSHQFWFVSDYLSIFLAALGGGIIVMVIVLKLRAKAAERRSSK